jgi:hypothetical protein
MLKYDPEHEPDPAKWLALDETERIAIVRQYHRKIRAKLPSVDAHAAAHAVIENQLAEGLPEAKRALARLLGDGLDRHEAIHAIASVLMAHIWDLTNKPQGPGDPHAPYLAALDELTAESWLRSGDPTPGTDGGEDGR